jgi:hypothetical protein
MTTPAEFIVERLYFVTYNSEINSVPPSCSLCAKNPGLLKYGANSDGKAPEHRHDEHYCCIPCACKMLLDLVDAELDQWSFLATKNSV